MKENKNDREKYIQKAKAHSERIKIKVGNIKNKHHRFLYEKIHKNKNESVCSMLEAQWKRQKKGSETPKRKTSIKSKRKKKWKNDCKTNGCACMSVLVCVLNMACLRFFVNAFSISQSSFRTAYFQYQFYIYKHNTVNNAQRKREIKSIKKLIIRHMFQGFSVGVVRLNSPLRI